MQCKSTMSPFSELVLILILFCSCNTPDDDNAIPEKEPESPKIQADFSYLALGDSYTVGQSVSYNESFPIQLVTRLEERLEKIIAPTIIAATGWRTDNLLNAIPANANNSPYDIVTLLIGVNNQYQNSPFSKYKNEFPALLKNAIELAGNDPDKVLVISIPDYAYTPFSENADREKISNEIDRYNSFARTKTREKGAVFIGITDITREGLKDPELVASDGLHPSGEAYKKFVDRIFSFANARLKD